jgi:hypothetical protein
MSPARRPAVSKRRHTCLRPGHVALPSFYEEMVTVAFLQSQPDACVPIKMPAAVALTGRYSSKSCIRYVKERLEYTVSLEGFELRQASPPGR